MEFVFAGVALICIGLLIIQNNKNKKTLKKLIRSNNEMAEQFKDRPLRKSKDATPVRPYNYNTKPKKREESSSAAYEAPDYGFADYGFASSDSGSSSSYDSGSSSSCD